MPLLTLLLMGGALICSTCLRGELASSASYRGGRSEGGVGAGEAAASVAELRTSCSAPS